jgi:hypothetical protein
MPQDSNRAQLIKKALKEYDLEGIIVRGPDSHPPWDRIRRSIRESASLIAVYGCVESAKVHNELGMGWGCNLPCFAIVERAAKYDLGIANLVLYYERVSFANGHRFQTAVSKIAKNIVKENNQLKGSLTEARQKLYTQLRREPSVGELAAQVQRTPDLLKQLSTPESSLDTYATLGQNTRMQNVTTDLGVCWKSLGLGKLTPVQTGIGKTLYQSDLVRMGRWTCKFHFMVFVRSSNEALAYWRNRVCQNHVDSKHWPVVALVSYKKQTGTDFRKFMTIWGADYSFLTNVEPGIDYFGPGRGYRNVSTPRDKTKISFLMTPTFVLNNVVNEQILTERVKSMFKWISQNRAITFPHRIIKQHPSASELFG